MTAPNIEMIADSLRNCSLSGRGRGARSPAVRSPPLRRGEEDAEVTVELNSDIALPYHWEQCLDMRTGQVYYRNWSTGRRTTEDPRLAIVAADGYYSSSSSSDDSSDDDDSSDEGSRDNYFGEFSTGDSSSSSSSSAYSPEVSSADPHVLVAAGCKSCFMYFMVPKQDFACPKCGRRLLHLGRSSSSNGCF